MVLLKAVVLQALDSWLNIHKEVSKLSKRAETKREII